MKTYIILLILFLFTLKTKSQFWVYSGDTAKVLINNVLEKYETQLSEFKSTKLKFNKNSKDYKKLDSLGVDSKSFDVDIKLESLNKKKLLKKGEMILQKFEVDSVDAISLMLKNVNIGKNGRIYFISGDLNEFAGPITANALKSKTKPFMSSGLFNSNSLYLLMVDDDYHNSKFDISSFTIVESSKSKSKARVNSVAPSSDCYQQYNDQAFSVGRVIFKNRGTCTFSIINNENQDRKSLALTARHCIASGLFNGLFDWNLDPADYENPINQADFTIPRRYFCGTTINQPLRWQSTGATYLSSEWPSDFLLTELDDDLPISIQYQGWDRSSYSNNTNIYSIHNPSNTYYSGFQVMSFGKITSTSGKYGVTWTLGETIDGSSGGPLFAPNNRIIGGLSYGKPPFVPDQYFKISSAWTTSPYGLKQFLSPSQNLTTLQTLNPVLITGPTLLCYGQNATINMPNLLANENVSWTTTGGINIVSSTGKSVVVTPINSTYLGMVTVTANFTALGQDYNANLYPYSKSFSFWVGKPTNSITNTTTNSTSSGYSINFSQSQTNTLVYNSQAFSSTISWSFPASWSKSGSTGSSVHIYSWSGSGPFTVSATNTCGTTSNIFYVNPVAKISETVVFPNEVSDILFIKTANNESLKEINLTDASTGKLIKAFKEDEIKINNKGDYYVQIKSIDYPGWECKLNCVRAFKPLWGASPPERLGRNYEILFGLQK